MLLLLLFLGASLTAGLLSEGVYHEDDLTHYVFARWAHADARYLLDFWGRPGFTVPYSWPAGMGTSADGLRACRVFSAMLSAASAWLAFCIARRLGLRHAWAAIPLLYLQPLFARLSLTTLTETPLAFYLTLATWLLLTGRLEWSAAIVALAPVTRDEAIAILPLWVAAMAMKRARWWVYPLLLWAVVVHNVLSGLLLGAWPAMRWFRPDGGDAYGQGTLLTFVPKLAFTAGPVVVALAIMGARRVWRRPGGWMLVLGVAGWFAMQTLIYMRGAYASGGYARFLVPICPWLAILACAGLAPLLVRRTARAAWIALAVLVLGILAACQVDWWWRTPVIPADWQLWASIGRVGLAALCILLLIGVIRMRSGTLPGAQPAFRFTAATLGLMALAGLGGLLPLRLDPLQRHLRDHAPAIASIASSGRPALTLSRWYYHWTDQAVSWAQWHDSDHLLAQARPGDVFVWDAQFCDLPHGSPGYAELQTRSGWRLVWSSDWVSPENVPYLACFERQAVMQAARPADADP